MLDLIVHLIVHKWGLLTLTLPAVIVWIIYEMGIYCWFGRVLDNAKFPDTSPFRLSIRGVFARIVDRRFVGGAWLIRRTQWYLVLVSILILVLGYLRSTLMHTSLELARAGALVVLAGLASVVLGFVEARYARNVWDSVLITLTKEKEQKSFKEIASHGMAGTFTQAFQLIVSILEIEDMKNNIKDRMQKPIENAQFFAAGLSFVISMIGTVVWAYGDQVIEYCQPEKFQQMVLLVDVFSYC